MFKQRFKGWVSAVSHGRPTKHLRIIGVYGADGGDATAKYLLNILRTSGQRAGIITSTYVEFGERQSLDTEVTEPFDSIKKFGALLAQMRKDGCRYVVVSLPPNMPEHQFFGFNFSLIVLRRGGDSYMDNAHQTARLQMLKKFIARDKSDLIINRDDDLASKLSGDHGEGDIMTIGTENGADCVIKNVKMHPKGTALSLTFDVQNPLEIVGEFTGKQAVYSVVCAVAAAYVLRTDIEDIQTAIKESEAPKLQMQYLDLDQSYKVILDESYTPDGTTEVLEAASHFTTNRVIAVIAGRGDVSPNVRFTLGEVTTKNANRLVVTDIDYTDSPSANTLRRDVIDGVHAAGGEAIVNEVADRRMGLTKATNIARRDDCIVILGVKSEAEDQRNLAEILES